MRIKKCITFAERTFGFIMKETRHTILQKAFIIFLQKGYYGTSITDIQKELDIGRATLYHHFANKQELFFAIIDELFISMGNDVQKEDTSEMTIKELINHLKKKLYDEATWLRKKWSDPYIIGQFHSNNTSFFRHIEPKKFIKAGGRIFSPQIFPVHQAIPGRLLSSRACFRFA